MLVQPSLGIMENLWCLQMLQGPSLLLKEVKPEFLLLFLKALVSLLTLAFGSELAGNFLGCLNFCGLGVWPRSSQTGQSFCTCWMQLWLAALLEELES